MLSVEYHITPTHDRAIHLHCMTGVHTKYILNVIPFSKMSIDETCSVLIYKMKNSISTRFIVNSLLFLKEAQMQIKVPQQ